MSRFQTFTPTPLQAMVMEMADKSVSWGAMETLFEQLPENTPEFQPGVVWDSHGNNLLGALVGVHRRGYGENFLPGTLLDRLLAMDPGAVSFRNADGKTPADLYLDQLSQGHKTGLPSFPWWCQHTPKPILFAWHGSHHNRNGSLAMRDPNGGTLAELILAVEQHSHGDLPLAQTRLPEVFALGVPANLVKGNQRRLGETITHPVQFQAFVAAGGDPTVMVEYDEKKMTLWERLLRGGGSQQLHEAVRSWAQENQGDQIKARDVAVYWDKLNQSAHYSTGASEISGILRSNPDFLSLRDTEGRNVCMYGIRMHASSWKTLEQKRFEPLIAQRDNHGRSLWYYALLNGTKCSPDTVRWLGSHKDIKIEDNLGRGLVAQLLLYPKPEKLSQYDLLKLSESTAKMVAKHLTGEQLFGISKDEATTFSKALIENMDHAPIKVALRAFFSTHAQNLSDAHLLGAAAVYLAMANDSDAALAVGCMERGGIFDPGLVSTERANKHMMNKAVFEEVCRINQTHQNSQELDHATPTAPARAAMRM